MNTIKRVCKYLFTFPSLRYRWETLKEEAVMCVQFASIMRFLTEEEVFHGVFFHVANEFVGYKNPAYGILLKYMGKITGAADFTILTEDRHILIEFKTPKGKLNESQVVFKEWCDYTKVRYEVHTSVSSAFLSMIEKGLMEGNQK